MVGMEIKEGEYSVTLKLHKIEISMFINEVLLELDYTHWFMAGLWLLLC